VIVLGGSSGIGEATAQRFASEGWRVVVAAPSLDEVLKVRNRLPGEGHLALALDVTRDQDINNLRDSVQHEWNGLFDVLVNSVGISSSTPVLDSKFEDWDVPIQVMLYGVVRSVRALVPLLPDGGRIVNITSIHHERVAFGSSAYGVAKAAITNYTRGLAVELASRGILANCIAPGFVRTPLSIKEDGVNELETKWFKDNYIDYDHLPLKRAAEPEEIAGVVWFLAGPDSSYITGSVITVDGGLTITF
jgi:3-oxoacyl-[acyl-carrier protein] reductase